MKKDYHIHAMILHDATDSEAFIRNAIASGIGEIAITDHMPLESLYPDSSERIPSSKITEYCQTIRGLAEKYADQIHIRVGIECDFRPYLTDEIREMLAAGDFDYVIGSSHLHLWREFFREGATRSDYAREIYENVIAAAESGMFNTIPHIDMYRWVFANPKRFPLIDDGFTEDDCTELIEHALTVIRDNGLNLEINPHFAQHTGDIMDTYPCPAIMTPAANGMSFVYGSDAHRAEDVGVMLTTLEVHPLYAEAIRKFEEK